MRELKFRAWDNVDKKVRKVMSLDFYNTRQSEVTLSNDGDIYLRFFEQIELMQYTGLKDKNSVEIYDGDILLGHCVYPECNVFEFKLIGEVYYSSRGTWDCYSYILGGFNEQVEVIGNIYENADLLEVEEDEI